MIKRIVINEEAAESVRRGDLDVLVSLEDWHLRYIKSRRGFYFMGHRCEWFPPDPADILRIAGYRQRQFVGWGVQ